MKSPIAVRHVPLLTAALIMTVMFVAGAVEYRGYASPQTVSALFSEYAFVGIAAMGASLVILSGGIDLSVGAVVAFTSILVASLVDAGMHPLAAAVAALGIGTMFGAIMGVLIQCFDLPAFMVTLAGMFAIRALGFLVHPQSLGIHHPFYNWCTSEAGIQTTWGFSIPVRTMAFLVVAAAVIVVSRWTAFGRYVYAIGGNERSARMMGLPVAATRIGVYTIAGACSALAGVVYTVYLQKGDPTCALGLELDVIAAVVIGGTLLSGGVGSVAGTLVGLMILGQIKMLIDFDGRLNAAWTSVGIGVLLLIFVALQSAVGSLGVKAASK